MLIYYLIITGLGLIKENEYGSGVLVAMEVLGIDTRQVERAARILKRRKPSLEKLDLYDPMFYPETNKPRENVLRFFLVTVALDHRLSRPGKSYRECIDNVCLRGADLLYYLAKKKYVEDPEFYSPERLAEITVRDVDEWLSIGEARVPDPENRAYLLRDLGWKLTKLYGSSVEKLLEESNNRLWGTLAEPGLIDNLRVFRAYEDPVEKKPLLLAKFLIARNLYNPVDKLDVAVDNHLSRIAYRLGLVVVSGKLWDKIRKGVEVSRMEDVMLRLTVRRAYRLLSEKSGVEPGLLDDYFWIHGRKTCLRDEEPRCSGCIFRHICLANRNKAFMVREHNYYNTWYY